MSNAANKNGNTIQVLADDNMSKEEMKAEKRIESASEERVASAAAKDVKEEGVKTSPPHLVVVSADAMNAERMGPRLRAAREAKDWTLEVASKETRIHKDYLSAIEDMMPNLLPGMPKYQSYLRGYLNNYARSLGMPDPKDVVQRYLNECGLLANEPTKEEVAQKVAKVERAQKRAWIAPVLVAITGTLIVCAIAGFYIFQPWKNDVTSNGYSPVVASPAQGGVNAGNVSPAGAVLPTPASSQNMSLYALTRAWLEVRGADGTVYLSKEMAPGEVYVPRTGAGWTVTARDGGAFEWRSNGRSYGTLAEAGLPVYAASVDEAGKRQPIEGNELLK